MKSGFKLGYLCIVWWALGCATIVTPSGGPKDITSPEVLACQPPNYSLNFKTEEVIIDFNEYIKLKGINNNLIVSPPLSEKPEVMVRGKSIVVQFNEKLDSNATYTLNFGDAIRDITEDNILSNFKYVFSTGDFLDSMKVMGRVQDAFSRENASGILVLLYSCSNWAGGDSLPYKTNPSYYTVTDKEGEYSIHNIKAGSYIIFALKDANRNFKYDLPNELIGFKPSIIDVADSLSHSLYLFSEIGDQQLLKSKSDIRGRIDLVFSNPTENLKIQSFTSAGKKAWEILEYSRNKDSVIYWHNLGGDTVELLLVDQNTGLKDTLLIAQGEKHPQSLTIGSNVITNSIMELRDVIRLRLSAPVLAPKLNQISLLKKIDSIHFDTVKTEISFTDPAMRSIILEHDFSESSTYQLFIPASCIQDIFGNFNDSLRVDFSIRPLSFYGNAKIEIEFPDTNNKYLVQLYNARKKVIRENWITPDAAVVNDQVIEYLFLTPGIYGVRVVEDANGNNKWDTGEFLSRLLPEQVFYYPDDIIIRSNWDVVLDWKIDK
jgi:uncharacterized protein (DUF2141 family)